MVRYAEGKSFVIADIPGLIEGAHEGKGLGIQFLRHIERTRVLVFLIESTSENPKEDYQILLNELVLFNRVIAKKKKILALTKMDLVEKGLRKDLTRMKIGRTVKLIPISSVTGEGIDDLLSTIWKALSKTG
jgi:GTP-binding protein